MKRNYSRLTVDWFLGEKNGSLLNLFTIQVFGDEEVLEVGSR